MVGAPHLLRHARVDASNGREEEGGREGGPQNASAPTTPIAPLSRPSSLNLPPTKEKNPLRVSSAGLLGRGLSAWAYVSRSFGRRVVVWERGMAAAADRGFGGGGELFSSPSQQKKERCFSFFSSSSPLSFFFELRTRSLARFGGLLVVIVARTAEASARSGKKSWSRSVGGRGQRRVFLEEEKKNARFFGRRGRKKKQKTSGLGLWGGNKEVGWVGSTVALEGRGLLLWLLLLLLAAAGGGGGGGGARVRRGGTGGRTSENEQKPGQRKKRAPPERIIRVVGMGGDGQKTLNFLSPVCVVAERRASSRSFNARAHARPAARRGLSACGQEGCGCFAAAGWKGRVGSGQGHRGRDGAAQRARGTTQRAGGAEEPVSQSVEEAARARESEKKKKPAREKRAASTFRRSLSQCLLLITAAPAASSSLPSASAAPRAAPPSPRAASPPCPARAPTRRTQEGSPAP